jgi:hypothetical protein
VAPTTPVEPTATTPPAAVPDAGNANATTQPDRSNYGPIVGDVSERMSTEMTGLIQPLLAGHAVAAIKTGERPNEDVIELWDADWKPQRSKAFVKPASGFGNYQLNSDGTLLARLTDFPFKAAQVYSFTDNALLTPPIKLNAQLPPPYLAGFIGQNQLMMFFAAGGGTPSAVEIWDVNKVRRVRRIDIPGLHSEAGSYSISRDGKLLAAITRDETGAAEAPGRLEVYNLTTGNITRRIVIDELQWNSTIRPSGISFNDTATKIAVLFEHQGQGLFLCWGNANDIPMNQYVYPGGLLPQGANIGAFQGPSFALVDNGNAWMIYGASVFDSATGLQLGDLKIKDVISQRAVSRDTLYLLQQSDGATKLLEVRLDVGRARRLLAAKE